MCVYVCVGEGGGGVGGGGRSDSGESISLLHMWSLVLRIIYHFEQFPCLS